MSLYALGSGGNSLGRATQNADTVIDHIVPPKRGKYTRVSKLRYLAAGTAHTVTGLRVLGTTTVASTAAAGQAVVNFAADPGAAIGNAIAANDTVLIRRAADGITRKYIVSSVSTLAITMTANLGAGLGLAAGDKVWFMGVLADTDPRGGGAAHPTFAMRASTAEEYSDLIGGVIASWATDEPILLQSNNITAAGAFQQTSYAYTPN